MKNIIGIIRLILRPGVVTAIFQLFLTAKYAYQDKELSQEESEMLHAAMWNVINAYHRRG